MSQSKIKYFTKRRFRTEFISVWCAFPPKTTKPFLYTRNNFFDDFNTKW